MKFCENRFICLDVVEAQTNKVTPQIGINSFMHSLLNLILILIVVVYWVISYILLYIWPTINKIKINQIHEHIYFSLVLYFFLFRSFYSVICHIIQKELQIEKYLIYILIHKYIFCANRAVQITKHISQERNTHVYFKLHSRHNSKVLSFSPSVSKLIHLLLII